MSEIRNALAYRTSTLSGTSALADLRRYRLSILNQPIYHNNSTEARTLEQEHNSSEEHSSSKEWLRHANMVLKVVLK